jgi:type IX secretion system PorP/SprF family membrane protein
MKKLIKIFFVVLLFIVNPFYLKSQDALLTQYYASPLYLAPSFAGGTAGSRLVLNYRNQWPGIKKTYQVFSMSYDHFFPQYGSGIGVIILKDMAGTGNLNRTSFGLNFSHNLRINREWNFRPGLEVKMIQTSIDFEKLIFYEQLTFQGIIPQNSETNTIEKKVVADFTSSVLFYSSDLWFGLTFDHMNRTNESLQKIESEMPSKFRFYVGKKFFLNNKKLSYNEESVSFSFVYKSQRNFDQFDVGAYWLKMPFVIGLWYRGLPIKHYEKGYHNNDAISILLGYQMQDIKFGYSYDLTISRLVSHAYGSHEISIIYLFLQDQKVRKKRRRVIIPCPKF